MVTCADHNRIDGAGFTNPSTERAEGNGVRATGYVQVKPASLLLVIATTEIDNGQDATGRALTLVLAAIVRVDEIQLQRGAPIHLPVTCSPTS